MTAVAAVAADEIRYLALYDLYPSPLNPRKTVDGIKIAELAESIRQHGILVSLLVRELPRSVKGVGDIVDYHVIAGRRRHAAAVIAGKKDAPCIVRQMTDDEARELAIIDNLQRADVPAVEEADAYEALRQQLGTAEAIAARVGKPIEYIAKRLRLVALGELQRQALAERLITVDHALLLARLGVEEQDANLKWALDTNAGVKTSVADVVTESIKRRDRDDGSRSGSWEPRSVAQLKNHIEQHAGRALAKAPWDLDDATLVPAAGACNSCPSNTAHNTSLFSDLAIEAATCEDGACFEAKREAFVQIGYAKLDREKPPCEGGRNWLWPLKVSWKITSVQPASQKPGRQRDLSGFDVSKIFKRGQWLEAKPGSCPHVRDAVSVDWSDAADRGYMGSREELRKPGEVIQVCVAEGCKVHPKAYEKKEQEAKTRDSAADAALIEKNRALAIEENKLRIAFLSAALETVCAVPEKALREIVRNAMPGWEEHRKVFNAILPGYGKMIETASYLSAEFAKAVALVSLNPDYVVFGLEDYELRHLDVKDRRTELIKSVRALGYAGPDPWVKPHKLALAKKASVAKKAVTAPGRKTAVKTAVPKKAAKAAAKKAAKKGVRK